MSKQIFSSGHSPKDNAEIPAKVPQDLNSRSAITQSKTTKTKMKTEKYKATGPFGARSEGEIIDCNVIQVDEDTGRALIMHRPNDEEDGSFEICEKDKEDCWVSCDQKLFVNFKEIPDCFKAISCLSNSSLGNQEEKPFTAYGKKEDWE